MDSNYFICSCFRWISYNPVSYQCWTNLHLNHARETNRATTKGFDGPWVRQCLDQSQTSLKATFVGKMIYCLFYHFYSLHICQALILIKHKHCSLCNDTVFLCLMLLCSKLNSLLRTRMHFSRMLTVRNSSRLLSGGLQAGTPPPPGADPPGAGTPREQIPLEADPLGADPPGNRPPRMLG